MAEQSIYLKLLEENLGEIRHTESHRNNITSVILVVVGVVVSWSSQTEREATTIASALFIIILGLFGAFITQKLYERQKWYMGRVAMIYQKIESLAPGLGLLDLYQEHEIAHKKAYPFYSRVRMNKIWTGIHVLIAALGVALLLAAVF